jgi:hypothetical protein
LSRVAGVDFPLNGYIDGGVAVMMSLIGAFYLRIVGD